MKRKLILKTIACALMLGGCVALTTCTKQKPNVLQTQQTIKRQNQNELYTMCEGAVDIDLSYISIFYFMPANRNNINSINYHIKTDADYYNLSIDLSSLLYSQKEYFIIAFYNIADTPTTPVSADNYNYAIYSYDNLNQQINYINNYSINDNSLQYENWEELYIYDFDGFIGSDYYEDAYFNTINNALNYINNVVEYKSVSYIEDLDNTINNLLIDIRDLERENNGLQQQVSGQQQEISSLNERIDGLNSLMEQQEEEFETIIATKEAVIENLQELDNLPTHLGGWFELVIGLLQNLWNMELLPHIKLGYFVALPILFTLVSLIIKLVRGA